MPLPEFADNRPLFPEERPDEALRLLSNGLQLGKPELRCLTRNPPLWQASVGDYRAQEHSATLAARLLALFLASLARSGRLGVTDGALDALSEAYALVGNFDASNWQTGEVTP